MFMKPIGKQSETFSETLLGICVRILTFIRFLIFKILPKKSFTHNKLIWQKRRVLVNLGGKMSFSGFTHSKGIYQPPKDTKDTFFLKRNFLIPEKNMSQTRFSEDFKRNLNFVQTRKQYLFLQTFSCKYFKIMDRKNNHYNFLLVF